MRYGHQRGSARGFSWKLGITKCPGQVRTSSPLGVMSRRLSLSGPDDSSYWLERTSLRCAWPTLLRPRLHHCHPWWCRNINLLPITYAFRPRLRNRLTHGRIILPQETLGLRRPKFLTRFIATHACISSSQGRYRSSPSGVCLPENTPLPLSCESPQLRC